MAEPVWAFRQGENFELDGAKRERNWCKSCNYASLGPSQKIPEVLILLQIVKNKWSCLVQVHRDSHCAFQRK